MNPDGKQKLAPSRPQFRDIASSWASRDSRRENRLGIRLTAIPERVFGFAARPETRLTIN